MATFKYRESKYSPWKELPVVGRVGLMTDAEGEIEITENGTHDVAQYASAKVTVRSKLPKLVDGSVTELTAEDLAGCTKINTYAFYNSQLTSIELPSTVTKFENNAFTAASKLTKVIIPNLDYWLNRSFTYNQSNPLSLSSNPILYIKDTPVTEVTIPSGVNISNYTFYYYKGLQKLSLDSNPSSYMCEGCTNLTSLTLGPNVTSMGAYSFGGTGIENIIIPEKVIAFGVYSFCRCYSLKSVVIQGAIEQYSNSNTFQECTALTSIDLGLPKGIPANCFYKCTALPNINIPYTVEQIRSQAFYGCAALEYVDLTGYGPNGTFPKLENANVFTNCGTGTTAGTFEIRVPAGRKSTLAAMTNWSTYADNIVEV